MLGEGRELGLCFVGGCEGGRVGLMGGCEGGREGCVFGKE